jgi:8-oxo-dGTP pyrophosphatase MutT (NUDIX family)
LDRIRFEALEAPPLPEALQATIDEKWHGVLAKNPSAFDGPNMSTRDIIPPYKDRAPDETYVWTDMIIKYWPTTYTKFSGTTFPEIKDQYGEDAVHTGSAVCAVIKTPDNNIVLHLRGRDMGYRRRLHVPGGILAEPDPVAAIKKEVEEELGISYDECPMPTLLGIVQDTTPGRWNHEFCFLIKVPFEMEEMKRRHEGATSKDEGFLLPFPATEEHLTAILELGDEHAPDIWVPTGMAALILYGRSQGWWQNTGCPKLLAELRDKGIL